MSAASAAERPGPPATNPRAASEPETDEQIELDALSSAFGDIIDDCVGEKTGDNAAAQSAARVLRLGQGWPAPAAEPARRPRLTPPAGALPARIGHYAIARKLGEGGMGVVYEARDERLERTVALKTMSSLASDETARKRFWREARAAASVNHPNICQIYEIGEGPHGLFIAMELLEGEPLSERLRRGPMSVSEAMPTALGILAALVGAACPRHRPSRPEAVERVPDAARREAARLRARAARGGARRTTR